MLTVEHLDAGYGPVQVLWDLNLQVDANEIVALIGSNGAGKTTLLMAISGLLAPRRGKICFGEDEITHMPSDEIVARGLVHVPQGRRLFPGLTVKENLLQGAYTRRDQAEIRKDLSQVLELFPSLQRRLAMPAGKLSGGEQQMVAVGRGIMARPKLLLIDELSLGLAPLVVDTMMQALQRINRERGTALLIVEQDVQVALEYAHRGYVLETGHINLADQAPKLLANTHVRTAYLGL